MATIKENKGTQKILLNRLSHASVHSVTENSYQDMVNQTGGITTGVINKGWRAKILENRAKSGMEQKDTFTGDTPKGNTLSNKKLQHDKSVKRSETDTSVVPSDDHIKKYTGNPRPTRKSSGIDNKIRIIKQIGQTSDYQVIEIQGMPTTVDVNPEATWATVKSSGRNNPFYLYTGGEDTISFDISWFVSSAGQEESVITKCRLLESWSRANGYKASPPVLQILWGNSGIYDDDYFILSSAKYTLSNHQNAVNRNGNIQDLKLLPQAATQSLVFKRVSSENRTHEMIINSSKLKNVLGISTQSFPNR